MIFPIGAIGSTEFKVSILALALAASALGGGWIASKIKDAEIARRDAISAQAQADVTRAALKRLADAQVRGDQLTSRLASLQEQADQLLQERNDAIEKVTTGRACLNSATVRVLNGNGQGIHAPAVSEASREPTAAGSKSTVDPSADYEGATDTDVAQWISYAKRYYTVCQDRLQALIDYYEE